MEMRQRTDEPTARHPRIRETRLGVACCAVVARRTRGALSAPWRTPVADGAGALAGFHRRWRRLRRRRRRRRRIRRRT